LDIGNIGGKITGTFYNNAELIGTLGGLASGNINAIIDNLMNIGQMGMPNVEVTLKEFLVPGNSAANLNWQMIWLYAGGWMLREVGFAGRLGKGLQDVAKGVVMGNAIQHVIHEARYNHY